MVFGIGDACQRIPNPADLTKRLTEFLASSDLRSELAIRAFSLVDGNGKVRIVDTVEELLS